MTPARTIAAVALALIALAGCGGDDNDNDDTTTTAPPAETAPPPGTVPRGASPGQLPQSFRDCAAGEGYPIDSPDEIHSAPPAVLQRCFGQLHGG